MSKEVLSDLSIKGTLSIPKTGGGEMNVRQEIEGKQATLSFDSTPTASSTNPVTSGGVKTALDAKQATITGGATTIVTSNLTVSRALASDASGKVGVSAVTSTELGYLSGVTSAIQTQLNAKQATITGGATTIATSNLTASRALVSDASGKVTVSAVTSTELGYLDGVTSAVQTQLNSKASNTNLTTHTGNTSNPHSVTKAQVGLSNVDNTSDTAKPISTATQTALNTKAPTSHATSATTYGVGSTTNYGHVKVDSTLSTTSVNPVQNKAVKAELDTKALNTDLTSHATSKANPHAVTKAQVGLSNVDNTSDSAKPISTATQNALNGKANLSTTPQKGDTIDVSGVVYRPLLSGGTWHSCTNNGVANFVTAMTGHQNLVIYISGNGGTNMVVVCNKSDQLNGDGRTSHGFFVPKGWQYKLSRQCDIVEQTITL